MHKSAVMPGAKLTNPAPHPPFPPSLWRHHHPPMNQLISLEPIQFIAHEIDSFKEEDESNSNWKGKKSNGIGNRCKFSRHPMRNDGHPGWANSWRMAATARPSIGRWRYYPLSSPRRGPCSFPLGLSRTSWASPTFPHFLISLPVPLLPLPPPSCNQPSIWSITIETNGDQK